MSDVDIDIAQLGKKHTLLFCMRRYNRGIERRKGIIVKTQNRVVNIHWYGSIADKPGTVEYIGRPSLYGNYISEDENLEREDKVALHRIWLHKRIVMDSEFTTSMMTDLVGKDLGCWCKHEKTFIPCHGDNYLREIAWLTELGWKEGMPVKHSYGLVDEYEFYRKSLAGMFPWDERNLDFCIWEAFLAADRYIQILTEEERRHELLEFLAKCVTRLGVIHQLATRGIVSVEKTFDQVNRICGYTNSDLYQAVVSLTAYHKSTKKVKGRRKHENPKVSTPLGDGLSSLGCTHDHTD